MKHLFYSVYKPYKEMRERLKINPKCMLKSTSYIFKKNFSRTVITKRGHLDLGQHGELKDTRLISEVIKRCSEPADDGLPHRAVVIK